MARTLDFTDGFESSSAPSIGAVSATELQVYVDDAAYVAANGAAAQGDIYFNSTDNLVRYYNGSSWENAAEDDTVVHKTGDESIAGNKTFTGTTTFINSTELKVTDKNITCNSGGDDASSEGAGITVDRDPGTDGSIIYADAAASKFMLGALGSEVEVADISTTQSLSNKTLTDPEVDNDVTFSQTATPANPAAGKNKLYFKSDNKAYILDSTGTETDLTATGGGGGGGGVTPLFIVPSGGPIEAFENGIETLEFDYVESQSIYTSFKIPSGYTPGTQVKLIGGIFATAATAGDVLFTSIATLIEPGDLISDTTDQHTSTNVTVATTGAANQTYGIGDIDLTDGSGQINSVSVAAGDILSIELKRNVSGETSSATDDARLIKNSFEVES